MHFGRTEILESILDFILILISVRIQFWNVESGKLLIYLIESSSVMLRKPTGRRLRESYHSDNWLVAAKRS
jgi:hypothetical protein